MYSIQGRLSSKGLLEYSRTEQGPRCNASVHTHRQGAVAIQPGGAAWRQLSLVPDASGASELYPPAIAVPLNV